MKNKLILLVFICSSKILLAQDWTLYVFKTYDDFFNNKKTLWGNFTSKQNETTYNLESGAVNLKDSSIAGYTLGTNKRWIYASDEKTYYEYLGGAKKLCVFFWATASGTFNEDGDMLSGTITTDGLVHYHFTKNLDWRHSSSDHFGKLIKDNPELYKKYKAEKDSYDNRDWKKYELQTYIKYCKLYNSQ